MYDFQWSRFARAAALLAWSGFAIAGAWQNTSSWWAFATLALLFIGTGYLVYVIARMFTRLIRTVTIDPVRWVLARRAGQDVYGSSRWQNGFQIARGELTRNGPIMLGTYKNWRGQIYPLTCSLNENVLLVGPSRAGKGTSTILPTLLTFRQSCLVNDAKTELFAVSAQWREHGAGNAVYRFAPADPASHRLNFLDLVRVGTDSATADAMNVATSLLDDGVPVVGDTLHWNTTAQELLGATILFVLSENPQAALPDIARALSDPRRPLDELFEAMLAHPSDFVSSARRRDAQPLRP